MKKTSLIIQGPAGDLELRVNQVADCPENKLVVLSHPHPLYGGTMDNKVVTTMERAFKSMGFHTVAYNFRGVGQSAGAYDNGVGEQQDLTAVLEWAKKEFNPSQFVLAGFSFGSYVSLQTVQSLNDIDALVTIAPPVGLYDFSTIQNIKPKWTIVQGGQDEVVDAMEILDWAINHTSKPDIHWRAQASHFFHGELVWLRKLLVSLF